LHPRAAGLVASVRGVAKAGHTPAEQAIRAAESGDIAPLARFVEAPFDDSRPPPLLHHFAIYFAKVATALEPVAPEAAANAWMRSLAAWLALGRERAYLTGLENAILGATAGARARASTPFRMAADVIADLGKRADAASRDLAPRGRAALLALAWAREAARLGGLDPTEAKPHLDAARRQRDSALDASLAIVDDAIADANARGEQVGRATLERAIHVWLWSDQDEAVEHFAVDRLGPVGWDLYRARRWDDLRNFLHPFRPMIDHLAARILRDPTQLAYAAACAQMYVFLSDVEPFFVTKMALAEQAVRVCPTHRNGRLILAGLLCERARRELNAMALFVRREEILRIEAEVERAEQLYPQSSELAQTKALLSTIKNGRIKIG
jgi:hypothetical protein